MNATVSSIHINGWFGEHTKLSGAAGSSPACSAAISPPSATPGCTSATRPTTN